MDKFKAYKDWDITDGSIILNGKSVTTENQYEFDMSNSVFVDCCGNFYVLGVNYNENWICMDCISKKREHVFGDIFRSENFDTFSLDNMGVLEALDNKIDY